MAGDNEEHAEHTGHTGITDVSHYFLDFAAGNPRRIMNARDNKCHSYFIPS